MSWSKNQLDKRVGEGPPLFLRRVDDLAAICGAKSPDELWRHLVSRPTLRAELNDFDEMHEVARIYQHRAVGRDED